MSEGVEIWVPAAIHHGQGAAVWVVFLDKSSSPSPLQVPEGSPNSWVLRHSLNKMERESVCDKKREREGRNEREKEKEMIRPMYMYMYM